VTGNTAAMAVCISDSLAVSCLDRDAARRDLDRFSLQCARDTRHATPRLAFTVARAFDPNRPCSHGIVQRGAYCVCERLRRVENEDVLAVERMAPQDGIGIGMATPVTTVFSMCRPISRSAAGDQ
jgi:hypothetical protein